MAPTIARRIVVSWLIGQRSSDGTLEDVALIVSELVTRAIDGGRGAPRVEVRRSADCLDIEVSSPDQLDLVPSDDPFDAIGPLVLAALCVEWGVQATAASTTQWARVDLTASRPR
jgi:hypothetical protein